MSKRLSEQLAVHLSPEDKQALTKLAVLEGTDGSGYVRKLIADHLEEKRTRFRTMAAIFGGATSTESTDGPDGSQGLE
jgi:hypothetical protein